MSALSRSLWLLLATAAVLVAPAHAQPRVLTGTVTAEGGGTPLPSVTVRAKGTDVGALTDADGRYRISMPAGATTLVFSRIGYAPREAVVGDRTTVDVALTARATVLNEVVAIGYGEQSRARLTTAVSTLDTTALRNVPYANPASALQGTVPGLRVQTTSGQPGAAPRIILRGGTSINNPNGAAPLFVVDGIIRPGLDDINPADIERIDVLKDAGATAIYGARASNGVVLVTTRSARAGTPQFTYAGSAQTSRLARRMPLLSASDYIYFARLGVAATGELTPSRLGQLAQSTGYGTGNDLTNRTAFTPQYLTPANQHKLQEGWQQMPDPLDPTKTIIFQETDWQDVLFRRGLTQNHHLSVSGGSDVGAYNLAVGYLDNQGIAVTTGYRRLTLDMGGRVQARKRLTLGGDLGLSNAEDAQVFNENQIFQRARSSTRTRSSSAPSACRRRPSCTSRTGRSRRGRVAASGTRSTTSAAPGRTTGTTGSASGCARCGRSRPGSPSSPPPRSSTTAGGATRSSCPTSTPRRSSWTPATRRRRTTSGGSGRRTRCSPTGAPSRATTSSSRPGRRTSTAGSRR
jgi:TonB-linked SusC/RagA family outer membrane protein